MELHPTGTVLWAKQFGTGTSGPGTYPFAIAGNDDIFFGGYFQDSIDMGGGVLKGGPWGGFVARYSSSGTHLWSQAFQGSDDPGLTKIALDSFQNLIVYGDFFGSIDLIGVLGDVKYTTQNVDLYLGKFRPGP
jgi:hypothetical protein